MAAMKETKTEKPGRRLSFGERWALDEDCFTAPPPNPAKQRYARELAEAIGKAKAAGSRESITTKDGAEIYAYAHKDGIAWGINAAETGANVLRGIRRPDGSDIAEG